MKLLFSIPLVIGNFAVSAELLVESGKSNYVIVLSSEAIPAEKTAAKELQSFLKQISGAELPIADKTSGPAIYVGQSRESARALGIADWKKLLPDEIILRRVGDNLYLAGDRPRGTLYAVYELLEKQFGVRFWTPSATDVPKSETLKLPDVNHRYAPPFEVRSTGCILMRLNPVFAVRSRNNGQSLMIPEEWGGQIVPLGNVHTFCQFSENALIPADRFFDVHPEWYSERGGRRISNGQLCLSNRELRKELCRQVLKRLEASPGARYVSVSQNDNELYCECRNCVEFVRKYGRQSDLLVYAVNEVASAVKKKYPGVYVETLAYQYTRVPPKRMKAADNVIIRYCTFEADFFRPLSAKENQSLHHDLAAWSKAAKHLMIWNYIINFHKYYLPFPNWHTLGPDLRTFRKFHTISMYEQGAWNGGGAIADLGELRSWLVSKLLWNPDLKTEVLMDEFLNAFYGPGAFAVRRYINLMTASAAAHPKVFGSGFADSTKEWLDEKSLLEAWEVMESACRRFKEDPVYGPRLAAASVPVNCALLERRRLLESWNCSDPELKKLKTFEQIAEIVGRMKTAGVMRIREGDDKSTPEEWGANMDLDLRVVNGILPNDGEISDFAKTPCFIWSVGRIGNLSGMGKNVFLEKDSAASTGKAVCMPNTHGERAVQLKKHPYGTFKLFMEIRCDASAPAGDAIEIGTFDDVKKQKRSKFFSASKIMGKSYQIVKIGTVKLDDTSWIFAAPVMNSSVRTVWIDRVILVHCNVQ